MHKSSAVHVPSSAGGVVSGSAQRRLAELYARNAPSALRLAYLMTGDAAAAEDIVQESFVRMFARFQDRKAPDVVEAYLRRTIINLAHDRHRRTKTFRAFLARSSTEPTGQDSPDVESRLVMRARLAKLPQRQRAALVLRYYEDLSESQAAEILRCSPGAVKQLVQRGLKVLRNQEDDR